MTVDEFVESIRTFSVEPSAWPPPAWTSLSRGNLRTLLAIIERQRTALEKIDGHIVSDASDAAAMFQEIAREELEKEF